MLLKIVSIAIRENGVLRTDTQTLFECPAGHTTTLTAIAVVNADAVQRTMNLMLQLGNNASRRMVSKDLILDPGHTMESDMAWVLRGGDKLVGNASANGVLEWNVAGEQI